MSEIVKRLRMSAASTEVHEICEPYGALLDEAADEIERLREALRPLAIIADIYSDEEDGRHQIWIDSTEREVKALTVAVCRLAAV